MKFNAIFGLIGLIALVLSVIVFIGDKKVLNEINSKNDSIISVDSQGIYNAILKEKAKEMLFENNRRNYYQSHKTYAVFWVTYTCEFEDMMKLPPLQKNEMGAYSAVFEIDHWDEEIKSKYLDEYFTNIPCGNKWKTNHHDYINTRNAKIFDSYSEASNWRYDNLVQKYSQE